MQKWRVSYMTDEDDSCNVWVYADSKEEAESNVQREYHDIERIIDCYKID